MNVSQLAKILIEDLGRQGDEVDPKIGVLATRMLMQIQSAPALMAHLVDFQLIPGDSPKDPVKLQFDFMQLPKEIIPDLERLLTLGYFSKSRLVKYIKHGQARTGVEVQVQPSDLPGDEYSYAY